MTIRSRTRKRVLALTAAVGLIGTLVVAVLPGSAGASNPPGALLVKALGSRYSDTSYISAVGRPGRTQTFQLLLNNNTGTAQSFDLNLATQDATPVTWGFYDHHRFVPGNAYSTQQIADGGTFSLQVVAIPSQSAVAGDSYEAELTMTPDGDPNTVLSDKNLVVSMTAPPIGSGGILFVQAAGQATVGGDDGSFGAASSPALVAPKSATYKITVVNNSGETSNIQMVAEAEYDGWCDDSFVNTIKTGGIDVTSDVFGFSYSSPLVAPGTALTFNLTVKYGSDTGSCNAQEITFLASDGLDEAIAATVTPIAFSG